jgi:hypothetical protein
MSHSRRIEGGGRVLQVSNALQRSTRVCKSSRLVYGRAGRDSMMMKLPLQNAS